MNKLLYFGLFSNPLSSSHSRAASLVALGLVCLGACGSSSEGPTLAGVYPVRSQRIANGGSFPCDMTLTDDPSPDMFVSITDGEFGPDIKTCSMSPSDCTDAFGFIFSEPTDNGYRGVFPSTSNSGGMCSLYHSTSSIEQNEMGGLRLYRITRYKQGDAGNCSLSEAEKLADHNECSQISEITTDPAQ